MTSDYDVYPYKEAGRWHYQILRLMEGKVGASTSVYDSKADSRNGYDTKEEAQKAGLAYKAKLRS